MHSTVPGVRTNEVLLYSNSNIAIFSVPKRAFNVNSVPLIASSPISKQITRKIRLSTYLYVSILNLYFYGNVFNVGYFL